LIKDKVKFAVVGCGHIGKRHATMISQNAGAALVALADIRPQEELGLEQAGLPFFNSLDQLLASDLAIDVINIAVPNGLHATMAIKALNAGKHVVIEKPMTLSVADAEAILALSKKVDKKVFVVMQNRYSPPSVWLKNIVEQEKLGAIYMVQMNCFWNRDERYYTPGSWHGSKDLDGGTLFTQFSHFIDILYWVFGPIKNIQSRFADFCHQHLTDFEDSGMLTFEFESGGLGNLNFSTAVWDKNLESSMTIIAEKGSVKIGGQYMDKVEYCHIRDYEMPVLAPTLPGNDYGNYKGSAANHHYIIENVIQVLNNGAAINADALEGSAVVDIICNMYL
jgi:UDP-N-acetyl-2-amino-2-deoxyglucuronate dehydrogenase